MAALAAFALGMCLWLLASLLWAALVCALSGLGDARERENWPSYWLAWVITAAAPPLCAPFLTSVSLPVTPLQLDTALLLVDWTAPLQQHGTSLSVAWLWLAVGACFMTGVARALLTIAAQLMRARRVIRGSQDVGGEFAIAGAGARILLSHENIPVFCVGGAQPAIVLSGPALAGMTPVQVRMIALHEIAHLRRRDPLVFFMLECVDALFWFNPYIRQLTKKTRLAAEIACDAAALEQATTERRAYANALVLALEHGSGGKLGALAAFGRGEMPRIRLAHILRGESVAPCGRLSALMIAVALLLSVSGAAFAATTTRLATFGDPTFAAALGARVVTLYGQARCAPAPIDQVEY